MTLEALCIKVFGEISEDRFAVIKTKHVPTDSDVFGILFKCAGEVGIQMQEPYVAYIYPQRDTWELIEIADRSNDLLIKYNIGREKIK